MASKNRRWSSELVSADYKEIQATAMGLSVYDNGQFALLGGRKSLALINLSDPKTIVNKVSRNVGKWEISSVQWAPVVPDRIALAANDRIEIVNPDNDLLHEQILLSHTVYISCSSSPSVSDAFSSLSLLFSVLFASTHILHC